MTVNKVKGKTMTAPTEVVVDDSKYIVFKRAAFYEMMGRLALPPFYGQTSSGRQEVAGKHWDCAPMAEDIRATAERCCLPDAVVIRRQDIFAGPALEAYANAIQCVIEAMQQFNITHEGRSPSTADRLQEVADYFHQQSEKSYGASRKLPD